MPIFSQVKPNITTGDNSFFAPNLAGLMIGLGIGILGKSFYDKLMDKTKEIVTFLEDQDPGPDDEEPDDEEDDTDE